MLSCAARRLFADAAMKPAPQVSRRRRRPSRRGDPRGSDFDREAASGGYRLEAILVGDVVADEDREAISEWRPRHEPSDRAPLVSRAPLYIHCHVRLQHFHVAAPPCEQNLNEPLELCAILRRVSVMNG